MYKLQALDALFLTRWLLQRLRDINPGIGEILEHVGGGEGRQQAQQVVEELQQLAVAGEVQDLVCQAETAGLSALLATRAQS
jgi:hypothetical protein